MDKKNRQQKRSIRYLEDVSTSKIKVPRRFEQFLGKSISTKKQLGEAIVKIWIKKEIQGLISKGEDLAKMQRSKKPKLQCVSVEHKKEDS